MDMKREKVFANEIEVRFTPLPDITVYELAQTLAEAHCALGEEIIYMTLDQFEALGARQRHFTKL